MTKGFLCIVWSHVLFSGNIALFLNSFSFIMLIPLKEVDLDIDVASSSMVVQVYDPSPSRNYVQLHKKELIKTREALKDHSFAKNRAHKWSLIGDFFYKKAYGWKPCRSSTPPSSPLTISFDFEDFGDEFLRKLDEEAAKQKKEKNVKFESSLGKRKMSTFEGSTIQGGAPMVICVILFIMYSKTHLLDVKFLTQIKEKWFRLHVQTLSRCLMML